MRTSAPATTVLLVWALAIVAVPALAGVPVREDPTDIMVVTDDGRNLILHLDDGRWLRIVEEGGDGRGQTVEIDLSQLGSVVQVAMDEVQQALRGLEDLQIDLHLGADEQRMHILDDEDEIFIDLGDMISEITGSIAESLADLNCEGILDLDGLRFERHDRDRRDLDRRELEENIEQMKEEIARLQRELRRLRQRDRH
jgi:HAMP domain-containing protein